MKTNQPTLKQQSSVASPTCDVAARECCVLAAGGPRNEPHRNRRVVAAEELWKKERKNQGSDEAPVKHDQGEKVRRFILGVTSRAEKETCKATGYEVR